MKIKISSPNTKSESQNSMQYVLQEYILHTCHESAQSGPPLMCFHPIIWSGEHNNASCVGKEFSTNNNFLGCF
jgi:hypothetical protein